jgi:hypothetical protein
MGCSVWEILRAQLALLRRGRLGRVRSATYRGP